MSNIRTSSRHLSYIKDVVTLQLNVAKCNRCGRCLEVCPHAVFALDDNGPVRIVDRDACMECGACAKNCQAAAIAVRSGVGCAAAVLNSMITGELSCGCGDEGSGCCS